MDTKNRAVAFSWHKARNNQLPESPRVLANSSALGRAEKNRASSRDQNVNLPGGLSALPLGQEQRVARRGYGSWEILKRALPLLPGGCTVLGLDLGKVLHPTGKSQGELRYI